MVPSGPQNLGPKISKSLINNPLGVNKPVPFGGRTEPSERAVIRATAEIATMGPVRASERHRDFGHVGNAGCFLRRQTPFLFWSGK
jgi:hypothetical protein